MQAGAMAIARTRHRLCSLANGSPMSRGPDLRTATAARRRAPDSTGPRRTASAREVGSIGLLDGALAKELEQESTEGERRAWQNEKDS